MPKDSVFFRSIPEFSKLINALPGSIPGLAGYPAFYFQQLRQHLAYYLHIYADILDKATMGHESPEKLRLLDVGSGNGLLGIFAKYCGMSSVILLDIDKSFLDSSGILAKALRVPIDGFVQGEVSALRQNPEFPMIHVVVGTDMIEHVYNLDGFLKEVSLLNSSLTIAFSSAANPVNPFTVKKLRQAQIKDEIIGESAPNAEDMGKSTLPFIQVRRKIIQENFPGISPNEVEKIAVVTRGLKKDDILIAARNIFEKGGYPQVPIGDNTCDPVTGSWTERLYPLPWYQDIFNQNGFEIEFLSGFYNQWEPGAMGIVKKMLNRLIRISGLKFSPYFIILGSKKQ